MNISVLIRLDNSLLKISTTIGIFPDSLENIVEMRIKDILRRMKVKYGKIKKSVNRSSGTLFSLYEVTVTIQDIECDKFQFKDYLQKYLSPFAYNIKSVNMVIH